MNLRLTFVKYVIYSSHYSDFRQAFFCLASVIYYKLENKFKRVGRLPRNGMEMGRENMFDGQSCLAEVYWAGLVHVNGKP